MALGDPEVTVINQRSVHPLVASHRSWQDAQHTGACPVRELLSRIGDTWTVLVVLRLSEGPTRFRDLMRAVTGISQRMLTVTLRALERDGLVDRRVFDSKPPAVEYRLTSLGCSLLDHLIELTDWAFRNDIALKKAQREFDERPSNMPDKKCEVTNVYKIGV